VREGPDSKAGDLEDRLQALEQRLERAEDELAIRNLLARYGLAVDCGDVEAALNCHTPDALYLISAPRAGRRDTADAGHDLELRGHQAIADMLRSDLHQSLLPGCAHTVGPLTVEISGDLARATGYSRLYQLDDRSEPSLMRLALNSWELQRLSGRWYISRRESRPTGEEAAQVLLREAAWTPRAPDRQ